MVGLKPTRWRLNFRFKSKIEVHSSKKNKKMVTIHAMQPNFRLYVCVCVCVELVELKVNSTVVKWTVYVEMDSFVTWSVHLDKWL